MKRKSVFICAVWMIGVVPNAYGACVTYFPDAFHTGCSSDADCEEETTSGGMATVACPVFSIDGTFYVGIKRHTFTHNCVKTRTYDHINCTYNSNGSCGVRVTSTTRYACCMGYYGSCSDNTDITTCTCTRCPQFTDASGSKYGTTDDVTAGDATAYAGTAESVSDCYISAGVSYEDSDATGTFEFTSQCNYSE